MCRVNVRCRVIVSQMYSIDKIVTKRLYYNAETRIVVVRGRRNDPNWAVQWLISTCVITVEMCYLIDPENINKNNKITDSGRIIYRR